MNLLITKHEAVRRFARDRYGIQHAQASLARTMIGRLQENTKIFGNLPIPLVADILRRPDLRYYHLIIPNVVTEGTSYEHLMAQAFFQRFHVEGLEDYELAIPAKL